MSVEPVHVPPAGKTVTSGKDIGNSITSDQYWQNKAREARAMREYEEERQNIQSLRSGPAEPPIQMMGKINLGEIDFQQQVREARELEREARRVAEEKAAKLQEERDRLHSELIANQIATIQNNLSSQIQKLQADLATNRGTSKSIADQLKEIIDSAALLGYVKPEAAKPTQVVQNATDAALSLEMLRLQLEDKRTDRQWAWQMEKDRREWQLKLRELDQANKIAQAEIQAKKDSAAWIAKFPDLLGSAIARGLIAKEGNVAPQTMERRAIRNQAQRAAPPEEMPQAEDIGTQAPNSSGNLKVTADIGEAGTIECPECGGIIAIGPTAKRAVCSNCELAVEVVRKEATTDAN